jgi:hypothetical protein
MLKSTLVFGTVLLIQSCGGGPSTTQQPPPPPPAAATPTFWPGAGTYSPTQITLTGNCGGALEFHLDSLSGTLAGSVTIPLTAGWQTWSTASAPASASGVHDLYVVFKAPPSGTSSLGNFNWLQFN